MLTILKYSFVILFFLSSYTCSSHLKNELNLRNDVNILNEIVNDEYRFKKLLDARERVELVWKLFDWVKSNGGFVHPSLTPFVKNVMTNDIGIRTSEDIPELTTYGELPEKCLISHNVALNDSVVGDSLRKLNLNHSSRSHQIVCMTIFVMYHRYILKERSFFHPYLTLLPSEPAEPLADINRTCDILKKHRSFTYFSCYYKERNLLEKLKKIELFFEDEVMKDVFKSYSVGKKRRLWVWNSLIVMSRVFNSEGDTKLFPFWDMFDTNVRGGNHILNMHSNPRTQAIIGFNDDLKPKKGDEIFLTYSDNSTNTHMLINYGFVFDDNPIDHFVVFFDKKMNYEADTDFSDRMIEMSYEDLLTSGKLKRKDITLKMRAILSLHIPYLDSLEEEEEEEEDEEIKNSMSPVYQYLRFEKKEIRKCLDLVTKTLEEF